MREGRSTTVRMRRFCCLEMLLSEWVSPSVNRMLLIDRSSQSPPYYSKARMSWRCNASLCDLATRCVCLRNPPGRPFRRYQALPWTQTRRDGTWETRYKSFDRIERTPRHPGPSQHSGVLSRALLADLP